MAKILVVDDSSTVRDEVAGFLKGSGLDVATAVDGKDGLAKLKADPGIKLGESTIEYSKDFRMYVSRCFLRQLKNVHFLFQA